MKRIGTTRIIVYSALLIFAIYAFFFGPSAVQSRNMKRGEPIAAKIREYISHDEAYTNVRAGPSYISLGKYVLVTGVVPTEENKEALIDIINTRFNNDEIIEVKVVVKVEPVNIE